MNPHNSPWAKPKYKYPKIESISLYFRFAAIDKHLTVIPKISEENGVLAIRLNDVTFYIAKHSTKFRLLSHLDWAWYTPNTLADAINNNTVEQYYEIMLKDVNSDPNVWKDRNFEMELKAFYAARVNRCDLT